MEGGIQRSSLGLGEDYLHSAEFYKTMCTSMACRAGNYSCSLGSLFIIPFKYTGVSVRVTLINNLEVTAAVLSTA